jgi:hypothetical protein
VSHSQWAIDTLDEAPYSNEYAMAVYPSLTD